MFPSFQEPLWFIFVPAFSICQRSSPRSLTVLTIACDLSSLSSQSRSCLEHLIRPSLTALLTRLNHDLLTHLNRTRRGDWRNTHKMRDIPLSKYLEWPDANYVDPETRGSALLAINIVFIILVTLSIIIRLYSRIYIKHQSGIDDVMIVIAYICTVGITADVILANRKYGWDRHVWDVPVSMIQSANIVAFVAKLLFTFASTFTRLSLIFLFYRLIKDTNLRWYAWALHFNLALNVGILITFIFLTTFNCV